MEIFHLSYPKHGWIDVTFGEPPHTFTQTVSYTPNDCLRDLAAAIGRLLRYSTHERVEFSLEPGFMICEMNSESDLVHVVLSDPGSTEAAFEDSFPLRAFAHRVRFELLRIQPYYSINDGWGKPFPAHEVANLA